MRRATYISIALAFIVSACGDSTTDPQPQPIVQEGILAFVYDAPDAGPRVGTMKDDGTDVKWVTDGSRWVTTPDWAPNGQTLALAMSVPEYANTRLFTVGADGSGLTELPLGRTGRNPSWSPDGASIVFDDFHTLWIADRFGNNARELIQEDTDAGIPEWSPAGDLIAFTQMGYVDEGFSQRQLFVIKPDGSGLQRLASSVGSAIVHAAWSPDGKYLAFDTNGGSPTARYDLWIVSLATGEVRRITQTPDIEETPSWSPDGASIAYVVRTQTGSHIHVLDVESGESKQITAGEGWYSAPAYRKRTASGAVAGGR